MRSDSVKGAVLHTKSHDPSAGAILVHDQVQCKVLNCSRNVRASEIPQDSGNDTGGASLSSADLRGSSSHGLRRVSRGTTVSTEWMAGLERSAYAMAAQANKAGWSHQQRQLTENDE